jgi:hypothetical protein
LTEPSAPLSIREAVVVREEDDSATRSVPRERLEPIIAQARTEPGVAPTGQAAGRADAEVTQTLTRSAASLSEPSTSSAGPAEPREPREVTQEMPVEAFPQRRDSLAARLRPLSLALAALVLLLVIVVAALAANGALGLFGGGRQSAAQPTATTAPTAIPSGVTLTMPGLYQIIYPRGWLTQQRNTAPQTYYALLTASTGNVSVNIEAQQTAVALDPAVVDQQFLSALAQPGATPTATSAPASVTVGGQAWTQLSADLALRPASGQTPSYAHVVALSTQRGSYLYTIVYLAASPTAAAAGPAFTTANTAYFQPMLASFTFLS